MSLLLLFLLLLPFAAPSRFSCNILDADSCQFLARIDTLPKLKYVPYRTIVVDDTVDIHEAALVFARLMCVIRLQASTTGAGLTLLFTADQSRWFYCCRTGVDPYKFFMHHFSKKIVARENLCEALKYKFGPWLIFSGADGTYCGDSDPPPTLNLLLGRWYKSNDIRYPNGSLVKSAGERAVARRTLYPLDVRQAGSYVSAYALVYRLADVPFNSSLVKVGIVKVRHGGSDSPLPSRGLFLSCFYMACLLVFILILFLSLLDLVNVDENYTFVLQQIIQHRLRRQRARMMAENGANRDEEEEGEGEEAVERPNRRNRLNSEERSLLGTDENTIRTALSGRFPSVSSLSFHSAGSRPTRASLESLVIDEPSEVKTSSVWDDKKKQEEPKK